MTRVIAALSDTRHTAGADAFARLLDEAAWRGWTVERDAELPMYGPYVVVAPHGEFCGQGFGRADSLGIAMTMAKEAERVQAA